MYEQSVSYDLNQVTPCWAPVKKITTTAMRGHSHSREYIKEGPADEASLGPAVDSASAWAPPTPDLVRPVPDSEPTYDKMGLDFQVATPSLAGRYYHTHQCPTPASPLIFHR